MAERTLPKGVCLSGGRYFAYASTNGRRKHLGSYGTLEEAVAARAAWREQNPKPGSDQSWETPPWPPAAQRTRHYPPGYEEAEFAEALHWILTNTTWGLGQPWERGRLKPAGAPATSDHRPAPGGPAVGVARLGN
jgi:hypothetical protein